MSFKTSGACKNDKRETDGWADRQAETKRDKERGRKAARQRVREAEMHNLVPRLLLNFSITHYTTKKLEEPENNVNHVDIHHILCLQVTYTHTHHVLHCAY